MQMKLRFFPGSSRILSRFFVGVSIPFYLFIFFIPSFLLFFFFFFSCPEMINNQTKNATLLVLMRWTRKQTDVICK